MKNRSDYINELNSFLSSSKSCILKICEDLGWNNGYEAMSQKQDDVEECPLDSGHRMPKKSLPSHIEKCQLHKQGYSDSSLMFPPLCEAGPHTVTIDEATLNTIIQPCGGVNVHGDNAPIRKAVPLTSDRLMTDFTSEERLAIYDYAVKNTNRCSKEDVKEINLTSQDVQDAKPMTLEELAAAGRDAKRRRIRYKSKKVHTNRKSRTEVIRAVIQSQMDGYVEWIKQQTGESVEEDSEPASSEGQKPKPDCSNTVQETTNSIKEIRHGWEQWDYYGLNPHKRHINVLKEEADKKIKEDKKFLEKHKTRTKDFYSSRYNEDKERNRREVSSSDYKKYRYDESHSRYKSNKYHVERNEVNSKEHRARENDMFDTPRIKIEPHSSSYDKHKIDHGSERKDFKDIKYHSSSKFYTSENYDYDPADHIHTRKHVEKRIHSSPPKNFSSINSHSESERERRHKSNSRETRHKSHKNKKKKHSSKKKKRKRHSSTESSDTEES